MPKREYKSVSREEESGEEKQPEQSVETLRKKMLGDSDNLKDVLDEIHSNGNAICKDRKSMIDFVVSLEKLALDRLHQFNKMLIEQEIKNNCAVDKNQFMRSGSFGKILLAYEFAKYPNILKLNEHIDTIQQHFGSSEGYDNFRKVIFDIVIERVKCSTERLPEQQIRHREKVLIYSTQLEQYAKKGSLDDDFKKILEDLVELSKQMLTSNNKELQKIVNEGWLKNTLDNTYKLLTSPDVNVKDAQIYKARANSIPIKNSSLRKFCALMNAIGEYVLRFLAFVSEPVASSKSKNLREGGLRLFELNQKDAKDAQEVSEVRGKFKSLMQKVAVKDKKDEQSGESSPSSKGPGSR